MEEFDGRTELTKSQEQGGKHFMKRFISIVLVCLLVFGTFRTGLAEDPWTCSSCGTVSTGKFCSECGAPKPDPAAPEAVQDDMYSLKLIIHYQGNLIMAKYDVELRIDHKPITTMKHGQGYSGEVSVTPGSHEIRFVKTDDSSVSGSYVVNIEADTSFSCTIKSKMLGISVDDVTIRSEALQQLSPEGDTTKGHDDDSMIADSEPETDSFLRGPLKLEVAIDFVKNKIFSTYDVDVYLDDTFVASISHGTGYNGTFGVTKGIHVLTFQKSGDRTINGRSQFNVDEDTAFSCTIECKKNQVKVTKEKIGKDGKGLSLSREDYLSACKTINYKDVERNPDQFNGIKTRITGKVIQVVEGWFDSVTLRIKDTNADVWYVTYTKQKGESRILEDDNVIIYGECKGIKTYTTLLGGSVAIPAVEAKYIELK